MSRKGNSLDNAPIENTFYHLKEALMKYITIKNLQEVVQIVDDYIHFFNYDRIQLKNKLTPVEFRRQFV